VPHSLLFVDDSGNREYAAQGEQYGPGKSRHFVYGAVFDASSFLLRGTSGAFDRRAPTVFESRRSTALKALSVIGPVLISHASGSACDHASLSLGRVGVLEFARGLHIGERCSDLRRDFRSSSHCAERPACDGWQSPCRGGRGRRRARDASGILTRQRRQCWWLVRAMDVVGGRRAASQRSSNTHRKRVLGLSCSLFTRGVWARVARSSHEALRPRKGRSRARFASLPQNDDVVCGLAAGNGELAVGVNGKTKNIV
jgi:hypothetical protein